ncbi:MULTISPECIES: putative RNA methyltransferase [unclassified Halomonas]|uniref:putative RNA methyltransferase n=1 Tax=unclassified Halomonas TaxID=2609666 RepID=UPI00209F3227|nr:MULTISPECIES: methyltransferase domain-containing protein [unclassified Halomonas]MCP1314776.1 methyltransferase domain-containing protein [Halomonas sp. 707D7]MCP1327214.1 methyltransferase domain-containing protein [Halomonas sp. 707D4]
MSSTSFQALACPLDGQPLHPLESSWRCPTGHSFDIARQGYVNLLPVQNKRSADPGDSKEMVAARQRFLNAGHYRKVAEAVSEAVFEGCTSSPLRCLDAGCGEGYYLRELARLAGDAALALVGLDISKWAVQQASRQARASGDDHLKEARWLVGSNANLPIQDQSVDRLLCLFGFPVMQEFSRVLAPGGVWIQAEAGGDHLRELREIIYPSLKPERSAPPKPPTGFAVRDEQRIRETLTLDDQAAIADLLAMTPHLYRASAQGRERAQALTTLSLTVDVRLHAWVKTVHA